MAKYIAKKSIYNFNSRVESEYFFDKGWDVLAGSKVSLPDETKRELFTDKKYRPNEELPLGDVSISVRRIGPFATLLNGKMGANNPMIEFFPPSKIKDFVAVNKCLVNTNVSAKKLNDAKNTMNNSILIDSFEVLPFNEFCSNPDECQHKTIVVNCVSEKSFTNAWEAIDNSDVINVTFVTKRNDAIVVRANKLVE
jgi:hypothetical protein